MRKTFLYRLYPTRVQATSLSRMLEECRFLYNNTLAYRKDAYEHEKRAASWYETKARIPALKRARPSLKLVHSQVLQDVTARVDLAFQHFFRRVKAGETPGYPRFRGFGCYDSLCYTQYGNGANLVGSLLYLSKIGQVKVVLHRPIEGTPKTVCIRRSGTGKWHVAFSCEWAATALPVSKEQVGIDVGLTTFATLSTADTIPNPRFFRSEEKALAKAQCILSR